MEAEETGVAQTTQATQPPAPTVPERKSLVGLVQDWPIQRKIATAAVILIAVVLFSVLIFSARTANQQLLYANLSMTDASAIVTWLKGQKVPYSLKNNGKDIWIPSDQVYQTRLDLAASGLPSGGGVGFEVFDKQNFALTDYVQKVNYTRALQGELARTITSLAPVESTRVHLALPEKRLFKNHQKKATSSVIVTLVPGKNLDPSQVQGIVHLVAGSVTDLEADNVKVIDSNGVVLNSDRKKDEDSLQTAEMLNFQQQIEQMLETRAQDLLDKTMGIDNAMVRVSATLDFSKIEKTQEQFDGDEPVIRSEQINQESNGLQSNGGIPGVQSNLQPDQFDQDSSASPSNKTSRTTNYEISKTISRIIVPVGTIQKLSVSVLVSDKVTPETKDKPATTSARSEAELLSIKNMVGTAIGIVPDRGDIINVTSMPFVAAISGDQGTGFSSGMNWHTYIPAMKYGLLAIGAFLIYFLLIRPVIKTMKGEVKSHYKTVEQLELEHKARQEEIVIEPPQPVDDAITALRREVQQNQTPTAFIVKNWIQEG